MTWSGEEVTKTLGIAINENDEKTFKNLCGLAYRNNPKRAHLIVSKVLGKHIPQKPSVLDNAGYILAIKINAILGGRNSTFDVEQWSDGFPKNSQNPLKNVRGEELLVFGYAETATNLGAIVAEHLNSPYLHSTRYGDDSIKDYGKFEESHSHASSHRVKVKNKKMVNDGSRTIILVDDELTTGNTVMNTIKMFERQCHHKNYIIATLTDLRTQDSVKNMKDFAKKHNINIKVAALLSAHLTVPEDSIKIGGERIRELLTEEAPNEVAGSGTLMFIKIPKKAIELYCGVTSDELNEVARLASRMKGELPLEDGEKILVLGNEEFMYTPYKLSQLLEEDGYDVHYSTTTLSPVIPHDSEDYAVRNSISYNGGKYVYNIRDAGYHRIVMVSNSPQESKELIELFEKLTAVAAEVTIIELEDNDE